MRLASLSKSFTAVAVMILAGRGDLGYDDPAVRWVPELRRFPGITVRHLLNHTAWLPDYYDSAPVRALVSDPERSRPLGNGDVVAVYETWGEARFEPGERFEYSNPGYEVLALIIERVSDRSYADFLDAEIFDPLGMATATVRANPDPRIREAAIGYDRPGPHSRPSSRAAIGGLG